MLWWDHRGGKAVFDVDVEWKAVLHHQELTGDFVGLRKTGYSHPA